MTVVRRPRRDRRMATVIILFVAVAATGYLFSELPGRGVVAVAPAKSAPEVFPQGGVAQASVSERDPVNLADGTDMNARAVQRLIDQANARIRNRQYDAAIVLLNRSRNLLRHYPESYVLMGRALEGKHDYATARDFYNAAIERNPWLAEAYFGFATTSEAMGDLTSALGAMRSYLHTERDRDPARLRIAQARSALWEWEAQIGRGPWGPTKGIPPGFTAAELKRDGYGVGIKMPVPGTERPDGTMKAEIKHADRIPLFSRP